MPTDKHETQEAAADPAILAILMETDRHLAYCLPLARAASRGGKQVCVHFLHGGVQLLDTELIARLQRWARVSICWESCCDALGDDAVPFPGLMTPPGHEMDLIKASQRAVIF
jgi:hypothetical protein